MAASHVSAQGPERNACLFALPPNIRVVEAARGRREFLAEALGRRGYAFAGFTAYPDEREMKVLRAEDALRAKLATEHRKKQPGSVAV